VQAEVQEKSLGEVLREIQAEKPVPHNPLRIDSAEASYEHVLTYAGATLPVRDAVDRRVIEMVRSGKVGNAKATAEDSARAAAAGYEAKWVKELEEGVTKGFITNPAQVGGYPVYRGEPYADTDGDGLPDEWEKIHGLDPKNGKDATKDQNGDGYTNLEDFIHGLDPRAPQVDWSDLRYNVDRR
jgi:hypothetical protein